MDYREAVDYLYALGHETLAMKLGLENIRGLVAALGRPDEHYRIVHVAGTNGKGSFCAMLSAILSHAGIRTGVFTSPHLVNIEERFRVGAEPISREQFTALMARVKAAVDALVAEGRLAARPTFFEHVTALALAYFREQNVEFAVLEVGLGGRLDSTNIVKPDLTVITRVDYDHQQYLGSTLTEIAREKAGILKPGVSALCAPQQHEAETVIAETAAALNAPLTTLNSGQINYKGCQDGFWCFDLRTDRAHYENVRAPLRGRHQVVTAALAIRAVELLQLQIGPDEIRAGLEATYWPGRLELVAGRPDMLLDGAHNPDGVAALSDFLNEWPGNDRPGRRVLLFSAMRDKDIETMLTRLFPHFDAVVLVNRSDARAADFQARRAQLAALFTGELIIESGTQAALAQARQLASSTGIIVAAGSLHLLGEIKAILSAEAA